jgi:hypothetical protein
LSDPYKRWRSEPVFLLDDCFDCEEAYQALHAKGFILERHRVRFPGKDGNNREQSVKDPRVIKLCNQYGWLLVTTDSDIYNVHRKEIAESLNVGILATSHNSPDDIMEWVKGLIRLKPLIDRNSFRKTQRPWFLQFNRQGTITVGPKIVDWLNPRSREVTTRAEAGAGGLEPSSSRVTAERSTN